MHIQLPLQDAAPEPLLAQNAIHLHHNHPFHESCISAHNWEFSVCALGTSCLPSPSYISSPRAPPSPSDTSTSEFDAIIPCLDSEQDYLSYTPKHNRMPKRRTSLQSVLIPPFLSSSLSSISSESSRSSTRVHSPSTSSHPPPHGLSSSVQPPEAASLESSRISPPPDFLLDDDPFANYSGAHPLPSYHGNSTTTHSRRTSVKQPRSPLASEPCPSAPPSHTSSSPVPIPCSRSASNPSRISPPTPPVSGRQLRPAYTRPAFAPRPSLPSLHTLAQSDFVYPIKARKGTLGARLPLEPWDVIAGGETVAEDVPSFQDLDHLHPSDSPLGPEPFIGGNEDIHTDDTHADTADAWRCEDAHALGGEPSCLQSPISLELGPEETPHMFASLFDVLSSFSSPSLSRSPSASSSSSVPVLSPDLQTQWGGDSPSRSPNRSSSDESVPADFSLDDDVYSPSATLEPDDWHPQSIDSLSIPGSFSAVEDFQPGTSAGTIRPPVNSIVSDGVSTASDEDSLSNYGDYATPEFHEADIFDQYPQNVEEIVHGDDHSTRNNRRDEDRDERQSSNGRGNGIQDWRQVSASESHGNVHGFAGEGRRGGGDDDRRKDKRDWRAPSAFSTPSSTPSDTESEDSEEEGTRHPAQQSRSDVPGEVSTSGDDDVPLAQRIPTALRAQRTIRKQVRDEKDERRRLRALQRQQKKKQQRPPNQTWLDEEPRPHPQVGSTPPQEFSQPTPSSSHATRPRVKTLPSNTSRPVVAEDLARRLRDIQELNALTASFLNRHQHSPLDQPGQRSGDYAGIPNIGIQDKPLRPMRSFHRPSPAGATREQPMPMPPLPHDTHWLGRSATTASRPGRKHDHSEISARTTGSLNKSTRRPRTSDDGHRPSAASLHPSAFQHVAALRTSLRTSPDIPEPSLLTQAISRETREVSWQQRVFIVDLQRFNTLTMSATTTAKDVIDGLEIQGQLADWAGVGGWMLFEVSQDFGMERPIRHFEVVSDVINSWDKNKSVNLLVAKKTPLATLLHPSAMPSSSPVFSTYVEWESKPRKWSKRWLELREQGLWLSKKDNGKDETFLCSLANFDAYVVTRIHKSPKPYVFAVKSTDNLTFFENAADYVHVFCCSEKDGKGWLENVLLARSYFINQERNTISVGAPSSSGGSGGASGRALSRSSTRKGARNPQQPLVNVSSPASAAATITQAYAFEPGSLLAKR